MIDRDRGEAYRGGRDLGKVVRGELEWVQLSMGKLYKSLHTQ